MSIASHACYFKKLDEATSKCAKCRGTFKDTYKKTLVRSLKPANDLSLTFFTNQAEQLREALDIECSITNDEFPSKLAEKIPFEIKYQAKDNKVSVFKKHN